MFDCTLNELAGDLTIPSAHPLPKDLQRQSWSFSVAGGNCRKTSCRAVRRLVKILLKQEQENFEVIGMGLAAEFLNNWWARAGRRTIGSKYAT